MRIRFGYVANTLNVKDCSPSKTVTATNLMKFEDAEARIIKLRKLSMENLANTLRILRFNVAHDIKVYRLTSKLIPLATHPVFEGWDYMSDLKEQFRVLGEYIIENDLRVSSHPDHFTILNSQREDVHEASLRDLIYHENIFDAMGLDSKAKMVLHIGGLYGDKDTSIERFIKNFKVLPESIKSRLILENDDKVYTAEDVLKICNILGAPMVLDVHHDRCNLSTLDIQEYLEPIFSTWKFWGQVPKVHLSSPRGEKEIRSHADFIDVDDFLRFIDKAKRVDIDFDIMIEAKMKDLALLKLMEDIKMVGNINIINNAEIDV